MVKRVAVPIVTFWLLGACGAFCQSAGLPDAPSAVASSLTDRSGGQASSLFNVSSSGVSAAFAAGTKVEHVASLPPRPALVFETVTPQKESGAFLRKYLDFSSTKQASRYQASSKDNLLGRATDAAARIFVTRDDSGRQRVNTSYFMGVLTSVAVHSASRPYWARSSSMPLSDFGSTVGNDAGMNLMHEFGPGLRQAVNGHMPRFMFRFEKRIVRSVNPQDPISVRTR